jgi:precorrin-8X/cobalt-precorrin-8 methylmutase
VTVVPLFDRYIAVDWSANNKPKRGKDSIWSCLGPSATADLETMNHSTRRAAEAWLLDQLTAAVRKDERVLVGLDFPYGYPAGFAAALGLSDDEPWHGVWRYLDRHVTDSPRNRSNRFEVAADINRKLGRNAPFWGRPAHLKLPNLPSRKEVAYFGTREPGGLPEWRQVEVRLRSRGTYPQPVWKLCYTGSVGSQALVGIPVVHRLRNHDELRAVSRVWPFDVLVPNLPVGVPAVVHAEIWPSIVPFGQEAGICTDEKQVRAVVECWRKLDGEERLAGWFAGAPDEGRVRREEGWVLGVGTSGAIDAPDVPEVAAGPPTVVPAPRQPVRVTAVAASGTRPPCVCGCGKYPRGKRSRFMPGHDQRINPETGTRFNAH